MCMSSKKQTRRQKMTTDNGMNNKGTWQADGREDSVILNPATPGRVRVTKVSRVSCIDADEYLQTDP